MGHWQKPLPYPMAIDKKSWLLSSDRVYYVYVDLPPGGATSCKLHESNFTPVGGGANLTYHIHCKHLSHVHVAMPWIIHVP